MAGLLHKLWDETLAGPAPDSGLGKLRKYNSLSARSEAAPPPDVAAPGRVSRSITVLPTNTHRNLWVSVEPSSDPMSPSGPTTPSSPFSPSTPRGNSKKLTRRKSAAASLQNPDSKTPTGYDWIVLSALDR